MKGLFAHAAIAALSLLSLITTGCTEDSIPIDPPTVLGDEKVVIPVAYYHVQDADGAKGAGNIDVVMMFEPNRIVDVYMARPTEAIAREGSYEFKDGSLTLRFNDQDLVVNATVPLDTAKETVTLPFALFSGSAKSSTWRKVRHTPEQALATVFMAASIGRELPTQQAIMRVKAHGDALVAIDRADGTLGKPGAWWSDPELEYVVPKENGVRVKYSNGPSVDVVLFSSALQHGAALTPGPLAGDPRVHLEAEKPGDASADPLNKSAVIFRPHHNARFNLEWYDWGWMNKVFGQRSTSQIHAGTGADLRTDEAAAALRKRGYDVQILSDDQVSVANIIESLIPGVLGRFHTPGFIAYMANATTDGSLVTGTMLRDPSRPDTVRWQKGFEDAVQVLESQGYGDLVTYGGAPRTSPITLQAVATPKTLQPKGMVAYLAITPEFWYWLREKRGADLQRSLFFAGGSGSDRKDSLRHAVDARVFFGFNRPVSNTVVGGAFQYITEMVGRPTVSAEEAYYNYVRVVNTRQMIYKEDRTLAGMGHVGATDSAQHYFQAYATDATTMYSLRDGGWLGTDGADPGAIWWLTFAGRWGQSARQGVENMKSCWGIYWSRGKLPGLADPGCHNSAPGRVPTEDEYAYATYLLRGQPEISTVATLIPRWTLNDGN